MRAEVRSSLGSLILERTSMQNTSYYRGTGSSSRPHLINTSFLTSKILTDGDQPVEDKEHFTQRMLALIAKRTAQMTSVKKDGHASTTLEANPCTAAPAQAVKGHISRGSKENAEEATSASKKQIEHLQAMREVATTCKKDGSKSPVFMATAPAVTLEEQTENQHRSTLYSSCSHKESMSLRLDINKTVDDLSQLPGVFGQPERILEEEDQLERSMKPVERVRFNKGHLQNKPEPVNKTFEPTSKNNHSKKGKTESVVQNPSLPDRNDVTHFKLNLSVDRIQMNDDQCVPSRRSGSMGEEASAKKNVNNAECDGISEMSQPAKKLSNAKFEGLNCPSWYEKLQFEDVSGESENEAVEKPSFSFSIRGTQSNGEQMLHVTGGCVDEQSRTRVEQESIPDEKLKEKSVPPKTSEQAHHNSYLLCNESDDGESDDDQWIVIPASISELRYEPGSKDQEASEKVQHNEDKVEEMKCNADRTLRSELTMAPTCASSEKEVLDTVQSFEQGVHTTDRSEVAQGQRTPEYEVNNNEQPIPQKNSEQYPASEDGCETEDSSDEDSCDTEDSCDYPPESKPNHMTVTSHFLRKIPAPLTSESLVTTVEPDEQQDVPNGQTTGLNKFTEKLRQIIQAKRKTNGENISKKTERTLGSSDSEDVIYYRRKKNAQWKRRLSLRSESSEESSCSPERVDTHKDGLPSTGLQCLETHSRELTKDAELSDKPRTSERQVETTPEPEPEPVQHETEKGNTPNEDTAITGSDSESETYQNSEQGPRKRTLNYSEDREDPLCTDQVASKRQSSLNGGELEERSQEQCSDLRTETSADSESDRNGILNDVIILDSDTEDESDNLKTNAKTSSSKPDKHKTDMQKITATEDVIIVSDSDDDSEKINQTSLVSGLDGCHDRCVQQLESSPETVSVKLKAAGEEHKGTILPPANSSNVSDLHDTQGNETKQDKCSGLTNRGKVSQVEAKSSFENVERKTIRPEVSEETKEVTDAKQQCRKKRFCKKVTFQRRLLSSSEDSSDEAIFPSKERLLPQPRDNLHAKAIRKLETDRPFCKKRPHQPKDRETDSNSEKVHSPLKFKSRPPGSSTVCGQTLKTISPVQTTVAKPPQVSRRFSFPPDVGPSTSNSHTSSSCGPQREARQISAPSSYLPSSDVSRKALDPSRSKQSTSKPRPHLSPVKLQPLTPEQLSPTRSPSYPTTQFAKTRILESWKSTFPNKGEVRRRRRRRSWLDDNLGTTCHDTSRKVRPRPGRDGEELRPEPTDDVTREVRPRLGHSDLSGATKPVPYPLSVAGPEPKGRKRGLLQVRSKSYETTAPLMKKSKIYYSQLPKTTNREPAQGQSYPVGENYKWRQPKKGPSRGGKRC